jgi:cytochrome c biogenesis protein CcmG/thiol:disulfide interchange protein DsbE
MNRIVLLVGGLLVIPLMIFLALSFRSDPRVIDSPLIGKPAPTFELLDLNGDQVSLDSDSGQPVVLNFWATWCQPCIAEHPVLIAAARRYAGRVRFLGVVYQDDPDLIRAFVDRRGSWGPSLVDSKAEVAVAYGVYGAPETFFIDSNGVIIEKITGALGSRGLDDLLADLL